MARALKKSPEEKLQVVLSVLPGELSVAAWQTLHAIDIVLAPLSRIR